MNELDEVCTFIGKKSNRIWIAYAIRKDTKTVTDFIIGSRNYKTLGKIVDTLLLSSSKKICTDKLVLYKSLIPAPIHCTKRFSTNHIERKNLTLRAHLKRLNRRTICYSKSLAMLSACLTIYFYG